jgi:hypothetical protein
MMTKKELISKIKDGEINGLLCSTNAYDCVIADNEVITIDECGLLDWLFETGDFGDWESNETVSDDELYKMYEEDCIAYYENGKTVIINDHEFQQRVKFHSGVEVVDVIEIKNKIISDLLSQMQVSDENYVFQWRWEDDREMYYTWLTAGVQQHFELTDEETEDVIDLFDNTDFFERCYEIAVRTHESKLETAERLLKNSHPSIIDYLKDAELDYYEHPANDVKAQYKLLQHDITDDENFDCIDPETVRIQGVEYTPVNFGERLPTDEKEWHFVPSAEFDHYFWIVYRKYSHTKGIHWIPEIYPCESLNDCINKINKEKNTNLNRDDFEKINDAYYPKAFF